MGNLVIVAIPDESDRVWKVSSEKVPHLTLLFLGDESNVSNLESIVQFVEHAANTTLKRFYLPVDHRGELGADKADVLFFKKGRYDFKAVRDFRSLLLKDDNIKTAHDATAQFETPENVGSPGQPWIPHLTLGYPTSPAKEVPDNQDYPFYDVSFNRIAVWPSDFEGPEFLLKDYWDDCEDLGIPMDVAMSDIAHAGVKGMRWGVRNDRKGRDRFSPEGHSVGGDVARLALLGGGVTTPLAVPAAYRLGQRFGTARAERKIVKADAKFEKKAMSVRNFVDIHNGSADHFNREIGAINAKYPMDLTKDHAKQRQYDTEVMGMMQKAYQESASKITNKSGTRSLDLEFKNDGADFVIKTKPVAQKVAHGITIDDSDVLTITGKIQRDATGHISGLVFDDFEPESMAQTTELGAEFVLSHATKVSDTPWSNFKTSDYTDEQYARACLLDRGADAGEGKVRYGLPVREPDGTLNRNACHAAAAVLSSTGGTGSARGNKVKGTPEQLAAAKKKLVSLYKGPLGEDVPEGLGGEKKSMKQTAVLGAEFLEHLGLDLGDDVLVHYGIKGMHWGQRKAAPTAVAPTATSKVPHGARRKTKVVAQGGENHPASEDAIKVAKAKAKLQKSGTVALSNQELRELQERMNLERNVGQLVSSTTRIGKGRQFVKSLTGFNKDANEFGRSALNTRTIIREARA